MYPRFRPFPASVLLVLFSCVALPAGGHAGPKEFGLSELERAASERHTTTAALEIVTEITPGPPEAYKVEPHKISASDERGLMYGLLEAAEQLRLHGVLRPSSGTPSTPLRGVRRFLQNRELEASWYYSHEYWRDYFALLAKNRFNRLNLVFAHQTAYLSPPYPFWFDVEGFPKVRARGFSAAEKRRNLDTLCFIARTATEYGIDFTLGIWQHNVNPMLKQPPSVDGITRDNIGPYSHAALKKVLAACPDIRSVQIRTNTESGIPVDYQAEFYRDWVFRALREAGRPVTLDLRGWVMKPDLFQAAVGAGVPLRLSAKYWAEYLGRPYQPAETFGSYSYIDFLRKDRRYGFFFELWGLGSHRLLLWGDPDYVRRAVPTFRLSGSDGFEIDEPLAQKGYDNAPGTWGVFTPGQKDRVFWRHEFERYWLFYLLWGRLSYDPKTSDEVWLAEFRRRFGPAAGDALAAYKSASGVLNEIVATHMPDPNMLIWPEINPGGLIETYIDVLPSDWRTVANIPEAVSNRVKGIASAKQTPIETAARLEAMAARIEADVARVRGKVPAKHAEWRSTESDFLVLAAMARTHAHKARGAAGLQWFYETGDATALQTARREVEGGIDVWKKLVALTDGVYPEAMCFGPDDAGHWKDKLPWVEHDLEIIKDREAVFQRFGRFRRGFDFGPELPTRREAYLWRLTVEPRFTPVTPTTQYDESRGYGFIEKGSREVISRSSDHRVTRATSPRTTEMPTLEVLFNDALRGHEPQTFRIRTGPGTFLVSVLKRDHSAEERKLTADSAGHLNIILSGDSWTVSGLVVRATGPEPAAMKQSWPKPRPRPQFEHQAPEEAVAAKPIELTLRIRPPAAATKVRLHYRPLNQKATFRTLEAPAQTATFTIPGEHVSAEFDLMYYFEVLHDGGGGWFEPDPAVRTPYHVVRIKSR